MTNSREKGKKGEREFAAFLRELGVTAARGQQFRGGADSPDVRHDLSGVHFEVKRCERFGINEMRAAMKQAEADRKPDEIPVVAHRSNRQEWVVVLKADDFIDLCRSLDEAAYCEDCDEWVE